MPGSVHKALAAASKSCKTYRLPEGSARVEPQYGTWCPTRAAIDAMMFRAFWM
jgi:hypothetical protein